MVIVKCDLKQTKVNKGSMGLFETAKEVRYIVGTTLMENKFVDTQEITPVQAAAYDSELCLLVDENDIIIGSATKRKCHKVGPGGNLMLQRAFSVLLFNSAGELLVQKRTSQKVFIRIYPTTYVTVTYPNCFTNTCCSHPLLINNRPEDIVSAAIRRLHTDLGITHNQLHRKDFTLINRILYMDIGDGVWGEHELDYVLIVKSDVQVKPNPDEVAEVLYVSKEHFDSFMANLRDPVTPWFKLIHRHMLRYWWDNLHRLDKIAQPHNIHSFIDKKSNQYNV